MRNPDHTLPGGFRAAARRFFAGEPELRAPGDTGGSGDAGGSSGLSGSALARVEARGASWCLRRWPPGFPDGRLRFIHRVLRHARAAGFAGVPRVAATERGDTVVEVGGRLYDAQGWLAGEPLTGRRPGDRPLPNVAQKLGPDKLLPLARALAGFHRCTAGLSPQKPGESLTLEERWSGRAADVARNVEVLSTRVRARCAGEERRVGLAWLRLLPGAVARAGQLLRDHLSGARDVSTLCHADLWASHAHFCGGAFTGFSDFEELRFGSAAFDVAQLVLHFNGWASRDAVVEAYSGTRGLSADDVALLPAAGATDLAFEGVWALGRLYGEGPRPSSAETEAHTANLRAMLRSLEQIVCELG